MDENDRVVGRADRTEVHTRGLRHRAIHVWLFNPRGELFVQQRSGGKDTFPGCYDSSASGHLDAGEDYDAAASRELREELSVEAPVAALQRQFRIAACAETGGEFVWVYRLEGDYHPVINPAEIAAGDYRTLAAVAVLVEGRPAACAPSFRRIFREFVERGLWPSSLPAGGG